MNVQYMCVCPVFSPMFCYCNLHLLFHVNAYILCYWMSSIAVHWCVECSLDYVSRESSSGLDNTNQVAIVTFY